MIVNDHFDFFFYHIPKCGGTSVRAKLAKLPGNVINWRRIYKHTEARFLRICETNLFTMVRNPWIRIHSLYSDILNRFPLLHKKEVHLPENKIWYKQMYDDAASKSFSEWLLTSVYVHPAEKHYNPSPLNTLHKSMSYYLEGYDMKVFKLEEKHLLEEHVSDLIHQDFTLPHVNKSNRLDYRDDYTPEAIAHVEHYFKEDIQKFGYTYEG